MGTEHFLAVALQARPDQTAFWIGVIFGGLAAGTVCGLLPFFLARKRRRVSLATAALVTCILCGGILGLILALPVALVFTVVIVAMGPKQDSTGFPPVFHTPPSPDQMAGRTPYPGAAGQAPVVMPPSSQSRPEARR